jgi:4-hydroxy-3-methylbut-2-enyl diphosphate reductase
VLRVELAEKSGFCFGVERAVNLAARLLAAGNPVAMLGPLIHNKAVVAQMCAQGARIITEPREAHPGETTLIRAHGVPKTVTEALSARGQPFCDATCPFVQKIHDIVRKESATDIPVYIAGDPLHPEVAGIRSFAAGAVFVFASTQELAMHMMEEDGKRAQSPCLVVAQTTFAAQEWKKVINFLSSYCTNARIYDTICSATQFRQEAAEKLARRSDAMIVIGDRLSSNTAKLLRVCSAYCPSFLIEDAEELHALKVKLKDYAAVGVTAGASTPMRTIKEVLHNMSEFTGGTPLNETNTPAPASLLPEETRTDPVTEITAPAQETEAVLVSDAPAETAAEDSTEEENFSAALEENLAAMSREAQVKGYVTAVNPSEIQVDIGRKQTGYVAASEYSSDPSVNMVDEVKIGDALDLIILKTNDMEGTMQLSKKRFDSARGWNEVVEAHENDAVLEGKVADVIKGGLLAVANGMRVFIPASQTGVARGDDLGVLKGQSVAFKIIEVNKPRHRAVGSIRLAAQSKRRAAEDAFWAQAEVGQTYRGTVKTLTSYGAFVDIGGLDGMLHISQMSWSHIKHPGDVLTVGDEIEVFLKALDPENRKISLGYRKDAENPWKILESDYPVGSTAEATIVNFTAFGAFARVIPGVDGLIHISQIAAHRVEKPQDELQIGQTVRVKIVGIDFEKRRVSLSIRALLEEEDAPQPEPETNEVVARSYSDV